MTRDPHAPRRVLVIEDNLLNLQLFVALLRLDGIEATTAPTARQGLACLDEGDYDLVLLDLHLGNESGEAVLRQIRQRRELAGLPVMALTGSPTRGKRDRLLAQGFDDFASKPIDVASFRTRVANLLGAEARAPS